MRITHNKVVEYFFFHFKGIKEGGNIFLSHTKEGHYFVSYFGGTPTNFTPTNLKAKEFYNWMVQYKNKQVNKL